MIRSIGLLAVGCLFTTAGTLHAVDIEVAAGQSIQKAIDAAPSGSTIKIAPGVFAEYLTITKPLTLEGAGWDKTILKPVANKAPHTDAEKIAFADSVEAAPDFNRAMGLLYTYIARQSPPTISVKSAQDVTLRGLKIQGIGPSKFQGSGSEALLEFDHANVKLIDCAAVGPSNDGIDIANGSNVEIRHTLVAGVWHSGVAIYVDTNDRGHKFSKVHLADCDIRNCYYAGVVIRGEGSVIEHCRISGAAWHGIRYDDCSPVITGNFIFANARSGIYASGDTHAVIRNNIFWKNEMDAISCWFKNSDTIEGNTIAGNLREGIAINGNSKPLISRNVLVENPVAIECGMINGEGNAVGDPQLQANWFWNNGQAVQRITKAEPAPDGSSTGADPDFVDSVKHNYSLNPDSPARQAGAGAKDIIPMNSFWPAQPEEQAMVPTADTRNSTQWKKPPAIQ